jgi:hypothetical protein
MKSTLLAGLCLTASLAALAQGKVKVINDGLSLVVANGMAVGNDVPLPNGVILMAGLYGGTSSSSLFYYPPIVPSDALLNSTTSPAGFIGPFQVVLNADPTTGAPAIPGIASGTAIGPSTPWFRVVVWDSAFATYNQVLGQSYVMFGAPFQMNPGPSLSYVNTAPPGVNSTWSETPIAFPEPSTLALIGLGTATCLIFRRRR